MLCFVMMYLANISAGIFWSSDARNVRYVKYPEYIPPFTDCADLPHEIVKSLAKGAVPGVPVRFGKVHFEIPSNDYRVRRDLFTYTVRKSKVPQDAFIKINDEVGVSSPEYTVIGLAPYLSIPQLASFVCEITGKYNLTWEKEGRFLGEQGPVSTTGRCLEFCALVKGMHGVGKARKAVALATDNCASPKEAELFLMLTAPKTIGGFGLPMPEMNVSFDVPQQYQPYLNRSTISPDMLWDNVAVEYDSDLYHSKSHELSDNARKANVLSSMGIKTLPVRKEDLYNVSSIMCLHDVIAKNIGCPPCDKSEEAFVKRQQLLSELREYQSGGFLSRLHVFDE